MKNLKSYFIYFKLRIICELQYRSAALAGMTTQFFFGFVYIMVYVAFYNKTNSITIPEIPIISILAGPSTNVTLSQMTTYLWLHQAFYFTFLIRQRDNELLDMIKTGNIAYELCKPLNLYSLWFIKIMSKKVIGTLLRFWPIPKILTLILMLISSVILFFCIYLIGASFCFITTEGIEVRNILTEGGK